MCTSIFIGTNSEIPEVKWIEDNPSFHVRKSKEVDASSLIHEVLNKQFYYEVGSFMGCSCGLTFDDFFKEDNYEKRKNDVKLFFSFLQKNKDSDLSIFATMWQEFPDEYETEYLDVSVVPDLEFYIPEYVIIKIK